MYNLLCMSRFIILLGLCTCVFLSKRSQAQYQRCAHDHIHQHHIAHTGNRYKVPPSSASSQDIERASIVTIPVIFHIIHNGDPLGSGENISADLIDAQLEQLNDDFRRTNSDAGNTPALFQAVAADAEIEFCLAQQDPMGMPTTGIRRYNFGISSYSPEQLKHIVQSKTTWDRDRYLNIWVANLNGYLGYAYFPGGEAIGDGLTIHYITVGSLATPNPYQSPYRYGRTATHEIGHWLGLDHHWVNVDDCYGDDGVYDTPKQYTYYAGKPSHPQSSCSSVDMFMNFLDYVDDEAMNLYTLGQKNVMHAVLSTERSGIKYSTACEPPKAAIMFSTNSITTLEGNTNCSSNSKRIKVDMNIAARPSRTATVILQATGTAQLGEDFSLSPSQLTFPAGSTAPRSFDIIIHEDAYIEDFEDVELSFYVNSGGGNARKGNKNQTLQLSLIDDDFEPSPYVMIQEDIGRNQGSATASSPFRGSHKGSRMQVIYTKDDLSNAGLKPGAIHSISYYVTEKRSTIPYGNFSIKMALTDQLEFGKYANFSGGHETVYNGSVFTIGGKMQIPLDQPFYWDGHSNVLIESCYQNSSTSSDDKVQYTSTGSTHSVLSEQSNAVPGCSINFMPTRHNLRPVISIELENGTEVALEKNTQVGHAECELGAFQTVYFKDAQTGKVMLSVENLSNHDYGCTKVEIDRDGLGAYALWGSTHESTGKTFKITPEYNHPAGNYKLHLYFSKEEIQAWENQNVLGSTMNDLRLTKCTSGILGSSPGQCDNYDMTRHDFGDDYRFTAQLSNGFSGFTISNWRSGFLSLQECHLTGKQQAGKSILELDYKGNIGMNKRIQWISVTPDGNEDILHEEPLVYPTTQWTHTTNPGSCTYSAHIVHDQERVVQSNTVTLDCSTNWGYKLNGTTLELYNDEQRSVFKIFTVAGNLIWSASMDELEEQSADLSRIPRQLLILQKQSGASLEIRKLIL